MERSNDPAVVAAVIEGLRPGGFDPAAITCPTLVYSGGDDVWAATLDDDRARLGATTECLPGLDHAGAFGAAAAVLPFVCRFLGLPLGATAGG
ncbi:MAG TPA: hypothetical protein VFP61_01545 [Acidimicrobiales bacterium]|nr:hypothetical protein [Acidimicrobiales bacterium]